MGLGSIAGLRFGRRADSIATAALGRGRCGNSGALNPAKIVKGIGKNRVQRRRINFLGGSDPVRRLRGIVMLKLPCRLRVIQSRRIAGKLELLHHPLGAAFFALQQKRHVNLEFDEIRGLIFFAAGRLVKSASKRSRALA